MTRVSRRPAGVRGRLKLVGKRRRRMASAANTAVASRRAKQRTEEASPGPGGARLLASIPVKATVWGTQTSQRGWRNMESLDPLATPSRNASQMQQEATINTEQAVRSRRPASTLGLPRHFPAITSKRANKQSLRLSLRLLALHTLHLDTPSPPDQHPVHQMNFQAINQRIHPVTKWLFYPNETFTAYC